MRATTSAYICPKCESVSQRDVVLKTGEIVTCGVCGNKERLRNKMAELAVIGTLHTIASIVSFFNGHIFLGALLIGIAIGLTVYRVVQYGRTYNRLGRFDRIYLIGDANP